MKDPNVYKVGVNSFDVAIKLLNNYSQLNVYGLLDLRILADILQYDSSNRSVAGLSHRYLHLELSDNDSELSENPDLNIRYAIAAFDFLNIFMRFFLTKKGNITF